MQSALVSRFHRAPSAWRDIPCKILFLFLFLLAAGPARAQNPQFADAGTPKNDAHKAGTQQAGAGNQQKISGATTTVVVHGNAQVSYLPENFTLGTLGTEPLKNAPVSATVIPRGVLNDQISRLLSDVVKNDASVQAWHRAGFVPWMVHAYRML